jgi:hypothetical protein
LPSMHEALGSSTSTEKKKKLKEIDSRKKILKQLNKG